jgi:hypothetical protein
LPWAMLFLWCLFNLFLRWLLCCSSQRSCTLPYLRKACTKLLFQANRLFLSIFSKPWKGVWGWLLQLTQVSFTLAPAQILPCGAIIRHLQLNHGAFRV